MSKLNCRPGNLAFIIKGRPEAIGRVVQVIERAPECEFRMPCGGMTESKPNCWLVKFDSPLSTYTLMGLPTKVTYGAARDEHLHPIRDPGDDAVDETLLWTSPSHRSQRDADRCKRLVDEVCGVAA